MHPMALQDAQTAFSSSTWPSSFGLKREGAVKIILTP
jgi:hypothetical protein